MNIKPVTFKPLKTKLSPPNIAGDQLVARKALQANDYHDWLHKIVNVVAPAGYGKSMLLWQWYQQVPSNINRAWLNIDTQDNNSLRLMRYLVCACQQGLKQQLVNASSVVQNAENIPADDLLDVLLTEIEQLEQPLLLFMDDAHLITQRKPLELIKQLIHRAPPYLGIIIAGRTRLRIGLSKLKVSHRLIEYDVSAMHFNQAEITQFFTKISADKLTEQQLRVIQEKTEGWVAGMQLVALACEEQVLDKVLAGLSGSFEDIADYLGELVFQQQPPDLQDFLLRSSVLERFNMDLCRAVLGQNNAHQALEQIRAKQLFLISLDSQNEWYRYHHLFQDYLQQQLRQSDFKKHQDCLMRASEWCEQEQLIHEAIDYALKGKLYDRAAYLLSEYGLDICIRQFNYEAIQNWLVKLPKHYFNKWPLMTLCAAYHSLGMANYRHADQYIKLVDQWLLKYGSNDDGDIDIQQVVKERDAVNMLAISLYGDDSTLFGIYQDWRKKYPALENYYLVSIYTSLASRYQLIYEYQLADQMAQLTIASAFDMKAYVGFVWAHIKRALIKLKQGNFPSARHIIEDTMKKLDQENASYFKRFLYPMMAHIECEQGDFGQVEHYLRLSSMQSIEKLYSPSLTVVAYIVAAKFSWLKQDYQQAQDLLLEAQEKVPLPRFFFQVISEQYRQLAFKQNINAMLELQELAQAKRTTFEFVPDAVNVNIDEMFQVMQVRLSMVQNQSQSALKLLTTLLKQFKQQGRYAEVIRLLVMKAHVLHQMDNDADALIEFKEAFSLAIPNQVFMPIIEEGYAIKELIKQSLQQLSNSTDGLLPSNYHQKILSLLDYRVNQQNQESIRLLFYETLTKRENSILQRLDSLLTLDQLATELEITTGTLKWHLNNIYHKLQVSNRHAAVIQAKKFGLIA